MKESSDTANKTINADERLAQPAAPLQLRGNETKEEIMAHFAAMTVAADRKQQEQVWDACVADYLDGKPEQVRARILETLKAYDTTCDKVEREVVVRPTERGAAYVFGSYVGFHARLSNKKSKAWLRVVYHGDEWIFAEGFKVAAGEYRWTSPKMEFDRDHEQTVWESASLPYSRKLLPVLRKIIESDEVVLRFLGTKGHFDLAVTAEMKRDLKLMMDALAVVGLP